MPKSHSDKALDEIVLGVLEPKGQTALQIAYLIEYPLRKKGWFVNASFFRIERLVIESLQRLAQQNKEVSVTSERSRRWSLMK
ncbi:hypothetical protein H7X87_01080 [Acetobacteraceae bacterium]|nr:hypothetical protein [Candidatus Parcubacteria bacterium]